jgi:hypothetical protein
LITGTFTLSIAGVPINYNNSGDIPFDIDAGQLQAAIRTSTIVGFDFV